MPLRTRRVLEIGVGPDASRLIKLAQRHPNTEFTGVEKYPDRYGKQMKRAGLKENLRNLVLRSGIGGIEALQGKQNTFDHIYAHFVPSVCSSQERNRIFRRAFNALRKNGRLTLVDEGNIGRQLSIELRNAGFEVYLRRISSSEVRKLGTQTAIEQANHHEKISKTPVRNKREELFVLEMVEAHIRKVEGSNPGKEGKEAIKRILEDGRHIRTTTPFVVIKAVKRRVT